MNHSHLNVHRRTGVRFVQRGLSLTELMVALVISTLILIALVQVFINSKTIYKTDESLARVQENGRFAIEFLERDIRMAGSMGCLGDLAKNGKKNIENYLNGAASSPAFDLLTRGGIEGFDATTTGTGPGATYTLPTLYPATTVTATQPTLVTALVPGFVAGSDILILRGMDAGGFKLVSPFTSGANLFVEEPNSLQDGDILVVSDCERAAIFQATTVSAASGGSDSTTVAHGATGGASPPSSSGPPSSGGGGGGAVSPGNYCANWGTPTCPGKNFDKGGTIGKLNITAYYVGPGTYGGPSLFRRSWTTGGPVDLELVEGVENMQVLYGLDSNSQDDQKFTSADRYVTAANVGDWSRVVAVRVALLIAGTASSNQAKGTSETVADTSTYGVAGVTVTPPSNDRHLRRVFTTTVKIRNR